MLFNRGHAKLPPDTLLYYIAIQLYSSTILDPATGHARAQKRNQTFLYVLHFLLQQYTNTASKRIDARKSRTFSAQMISKCCCDLETDTKMFWSVSQPTIFHGNSGLMFSICLQYFCRGMQFVINSVNAVLSKLLNTAWNLIKFDNNQNV